MKRMVQLIQAGGLRAGAALLCALLLPFSVTAADVPDIINYQGRLVDPTGAGLGEGLYELDFRLWNHPFSTAATNLLWGRKFSLYAQSNGMFNVLLSDAGEDLSAPTQPTNRLRDSFDGDTRYLGMTTTRTPGGDVPSPVEMLPRLQLSAAAYAFKAGDAMDSIDAQSALRATNAAHAVNAEQFAGAPADEYTLLSHFPGAQSPAKLLLWDGTNATAMDAYLNGNRLIVSYDAQVNSLSADNAITPSAGAEAGRGIEFHYLTTLCDLGVASNSSLFGAAILSTAHSGYTGAGFIGNLNSLGSGFSVQAPHDFNLLSLRYAAASAHSGDYRLSVQDTATPLATTGKLVNFPQTGSWDTWAITNISLGGAASQYVHFVFAGTPNDGGCNPDWITFNPSGDCAWVKWYPQSGENCLLSIGVTNASDASLALTASGDVSLSATRGGAVDLAGPVEFNGSLCILGEFIGFVEWDESDLGDYVTHTVSTDRLLTIQLDAAVIRVTIGSQVFDLSADSDDDTNYGSHTFPIAKGETVKIEFRGTHKDDPYVLAYWLPFGQGL
ncbi:MAG: hypothetical protein EOM20_11880 [Spartobacteria bacterium]|nr:hypothetical protein [Spartobacteria bacterium]